MKQVIKITKNIVPNKVLESSIFEFPGNKWDGIEVIPPQGISLPVVNDYMKIGNLILKPRKDMEQIFILEGWEIIQERAED